MHILGYYGADIICSASSFVTYVSISMPIYDVEQTEDISLDFNAVQPDPAFIDYFSKVFIFGLGLYDFFIIGGDDASASSLSSFFLIELAEVEAPVLGEEVFEVSILFG